jgi:hypothetical protein
MMIDHVFLLSVASAGHTTPAEWLMVVAPLLGLALICGALVVSGEPGTHPFPFNLFDRAASSLERVTGLPAWCAGGIGVLHWSLLVAGIGFMWDVAWHIDLGRDSALFTPAHLMILLGIGAIGAAGGLSILMATLGQAATKWRIGPLRIPRGAAALVALGIGATAGFPLDDIWHANYGVDVTMWGPTHLLMIGGASLAPIAGWLLLAEAGRDAGHPRLRRILWTAAAGILLVGLSTFQLEFDDGVPQWQALYQPVLIAVGATLPMVTARVVLGRGAALRATVGFLLARGCFALIVGPILGHVTPHIALYLGIALCVEAGFELGGRRSALAGALTAGVLAGTVGLASEWGMSHIWGREPWQPQMLHGIWIASLAAVGAAVLGAALGGAIAWRPTGIRRRVLAVAVLVTLAALALPVPRNAEALAATVHSTPAGPAQPTVDRFGRVSFAQRVTVEVDVTPAASARGADWFWVKSWQGGGMETAPLVETSPGHWRASTTSPTGGAWKTIVMLASGDVLMAAPVAMPSDLEYGQPAIPASAARDEQFVAATKLLMREAHGGAAWPAVLAYSALLLVTAGWLSLLAASAVSLAGSGGRDRYAVRHVSKHQNPTRRPATGHV